MLNSLHIKNFRVLEDFKVNKLGQVNLIVGQNNSGKTTVLEALRIYAGNANAELLQKIAQERNEPFQAGFEDNSSIKPLESFFSERAFEVGDLNKVISIGELGSSQNLVLQKEEQFENVIDFFIAQNPVLSREQAEQLIKNNESLRTQFEQQLLISHSTFLIRKGELSYRLTLQRNGGWSFTGAPESMPCGYVPTRLLEGNDLMGMIADSQLTDDEDFIRDALQTMDENIENYALIDEKLNGTHFSGRRVVMLRLKNDNRRIPLKSMGEGISRIFQLILNMLSARNGILLIDEFESGLHYSAQEKIWRITFELARKFNIQVFATTHSWDCVESFAKVADMRSDIEGILFRVARSKRTSDKNKVIAVEYTESELLQITKANFEVR